MTLFATAALSLGVGCLNVTNGIGKPTTSAGTPAIVSGCMSLLSGSATVVNRGLEWPKKAERHNDYASRYGEVVRDINTECTLRHLQDDEYAREGDFIRHMSTEMNRLEANAPDILRCIDKSHSTPK
jgi:hypothetical protein